MAGESYSPNMNLIIPGVGTTFGPDWASDLNASLLLLDAHDHTPGNGVQITPSGLNINSDLPFAANNATGLRSVRMQVQGSPLALASDLGCIYVSGVDLYYNDENGNQVRITASGAVAGTPGSIASLVPPASATYVGGSSKFVWQSNVNVAADMDAGAIILRNLTVSSFGLTLQPPTLSADYAITLPSLPASQKFMTLDASGNMAAPYVVDNSTIEIATNTIQVKDHGITGTKLNANTVDNSSLQYTSNQLSIKNAGITAAMFAPGALFNLNFAQFTANGSWTVPANVTTVIVVGCGGGGGGAGSSETAYAQAGKPAPLNVQPLNTTPGASLSVTIGAGGAGGALATSGSNGSPSAFGGIQMAEGIGGTAGLENASITNAQGSGGPFSTGGVSPISGGQAAPANTGGAGAGGLNAIAGQGGNGGSGKIFVFWWVN